MTTRITPESLRAAGIGEGELGEIARQTRGGASGSGGFGYEDQFAIARLLTHCAQWFERGEDCLLTVGHPHCWVDDVVIERADAEEYSQLKTSATETWGKDGGRMQHQFRKQAAICRARRVGRFVLQVVTPHEERAQHFNDKMPPDLGNITVVVLFRDEPLRWVGDDPVARALASLCADEPEPSAREQLLRAMVGHYHWKRQRGVTFVRASEFAAEVAALDDRLPLRSSAEVGDGALWEAALAALRRSLPELRLRLARGFIVYEYLDDERGLVARADSERAARFLARLAARNPTTIEEFHQELP